MTEATYDIHPTQPRWTHIALRVADIDAKRAKGEATVPVILQLELDTNPFLRAGTDEVKGALRLQGNDDEQVFAEIRKRKDNF